MVLYVYICIYIYIYIYRYTHIIYGIIFDELVSATLGRRAGAGPCRSPGGAPGAASQGLS